MKVKPEQALVALALALAAAMPAAAQRRPPPPPPPVTSQVDFAVRAGSDTVFFAPESFALDPAAQATLAQQAKLLLTNPYLRITVEGHGDPNGTRNHALALGERRASAVRNFLVSLGVDPARLTILSWGKERPALAAQVHQVAARSRRVQTLISS